MSIAYPAKFLVDSVFDYPLSAIITQDPASTWETDGHLQCVDWLAGRRAYQGANTLCGLAINSSSQTCDTFAAVDVTLSSGTGTIVLQYYSGGWVNCFTPIAITALERVIWKEFTARTSTQWRVRITTTVSGAARVGCLAAGERIESSAVFDMPFTPPGLAHAHERLDNRNAAGAFLGASVRPGLARHAFHFKHIPESDLLNAASSGDMAKLLYWSRRRPFFYHWAADVVTHEWQAAYGRAVNPRPPVYNTPKYLDWRLEIEAVCLEVWEIYY